MSEGVEHWVPQLTQYILKHRIGNLSYPCEPTESRNLAAQANISGFIETIDNDKQEVLYRSVNMSMDGSPKRDKFFESRKFTGALSRMDSEVEFRSISNFEEIFNDNEDVEEENFANQSLLVGSGAK